MKAVKVSNKVFGAKKRKGAYYVPLLNIFIEHLNQIGYKLPLNEPNLAPVNFGRYKEVLYPYQKDILTFTINQENKRSLWSVSPRLGKTMMAWVLADLRGYQNVLFIAPKPILSTVVGEAKRFTDRDVTIINKKTPNAAGAITTNPEWLLAQNKRSQKAEEPNPLVRPYDLVVIDEAHIGYRNRNSQAYKIMLQIVKEAKEVVIMSGSLVVKYYDDLYGYLSLLYPKIFTSYYQFRAAVCQLDTIMAHGRPIQVITGNKSFEPQATFGDVMISKTFDEVVEHVPDKRHEVYTTELDGPQENMYTKAVEEMLIELDERYPEGELLISGILPMLIRLNQTLSHPKHWQSKSNNVKLELFEQLLASGNIQTPAVVWHHFKPAGSELAALLKNYNTFQVTSEANNVTEGVTLFQSGALDFIIAPIGVMSTGLKLDAGMSMVFYEHNYRFDQYVQALERLTDVKRKKPINIIHLIVKGTADMLVYETLVGKVESTARFYRHDIEKLIGIAPE